jgi:hypothetical protein
MTESLNRLPNIYAGTETEQVMVRVIKNIRAGRNVHKQLEDLEDVFSMYFASPLESRLEQSPLSTIKFNFNEEKIIESPDLEFELSELEI